MQDFNSFANDKKNKQDSQKDGQFNMDKNLYNMISALAGRFDGKSQSELIKSIYEEAKRGKENGTLTDQDIDNFVAMLSPLLDDKKRKLLHKIAVELKKI